MRSTSKAMWHLAATYGGYCIAWFALLVACAISFASGSMSDAYRGVAISLIGTLALSAASAILAWRWIWKYVPPSGGRVGMLLAFLALLGLTLGIQFVTTLLAFNR